MSERLDDQELVDVVAELSGLGGARVQRVDALDPETFYFGLRVPRRNLVLCLSVARGLGRVHLVERRERREGPPPAIQGLLRKRFEGRPLLGISLEGRTVHLDGVGVRLSAEFGGEVRVVDHEAALVPAASLPERFPISERIAARFAARSAVDAEARLRRAVLAPIDAGLARRRRLLKNLEGDRAKLEAMSGALAEAELMKTQLAVVPRGAASVALLDYARGETVEVSLDPRLSPKENLARKFARAKKAARGLPLVAARRVEVEAELASLLEARSQALAAPVESLVAPAPVERAAPGRTRASAAIDRISRRFTTKDGFEVRVGKGAKENDRLTLSASRGHDLWLHARGAAGAHVLLRLEKGAAPTQEALLDAAHLAVHYSEAKREAKAEVMYTEARYVRKAKGAPPGQVAVSREKTMLLVVDSARLRRLLSER